MATLQTNPSLVPNAVQEWTRELNVSEIGRVGDINIKLTLWDETSTAIPSVVLGSKIEIANSLYVEGSTVPINTASQVVDSINWLIYEVSGSAATARLIGLAPTIAEYDVEKGGFYHASGYRYTGHYMYVSLAGTAYSNKGILQYANGAMLKYRIDDELDDFVIDAKLDVKETLNVDGNTTHIGTTVNTGDTTHNGDTITNGEILPSEQSQGTWNLSGSDTQVVPKGVFTVVDDDTGSASVDLQVYVGGAWISSGTFTSGSVVSDGTNVRFRLQTGTAALKYIKF